METPTLWLWPASPPLTRSTCLATFPRPPGSSTAAFSDSRSSGADSTGRPGGGPSGGRGGDVRILSLGQRKAPAGGRAGSEQGIPTFSPDPGLRNLAVAPRRDAGRNLATDTRRLRTAASLPGRYALGASARRAPARPSSVSVATARDAGACTRLPAGERAGGSSRCEGSAVRSGPHAADCTLWTPARGHAWPALSGPPLSCVPHVHLPADM